MGMPAIINDWTVEMLDALPDDGQRYEIIDGVLFVTPGPGEGHQDIVGELYGLLREYLSGTDVGKAMVSPSDVRRGDRRRNRLQPTCSSFVNATESARRIRTNCMTCSLPLRSRRRAIHCSTTRLNATSTFARALASIGFSTPTPTTCLGGVAATIPATC